MESQSLAYGLFCDTQQDNLEYIYRGEFNINVTDNILNLAEDGLMLSEHKTTIKKRVYFILVEGLQNVTRHQKPELKTLDMEPGLFVLQKRENSYFVTTGNVISNEDVDDLKHQLDVLNSLDAKELKKYSKTCLTDGNISEKGGAGLGLIEIARKSNGFLSYNFTKISDECSYFYLLIEISFGKNKQKYSHNEGQLALMTVKSLHSILQKENITLNYSGIFYHKNMVNLLNIVKIQLCNDTHGIMKIFNIVVEMLENLVQHADNYKLCDTIGKYGIFFVIHENERYLLTTGNYIQKSKIQQLKTRIEYVNSLDNKELKEKYDINSNSTENQENPQLGIMEMRLISENKLIYYFTDIDDDFSFFTLSVSISTKDIKNKALK